MIRLEQYKRGTLPTGQDYLFDKMKDYHRIKDYFKYSKVDGNWKVSLIDPRAEDIYEILDVEQPKCLELSIYLRPDVLQYILIKYPKYEVEKKSRWEEYLELIAGFDKTIEKRASQELFKRTKGNTQQIREVLEELTMLFYEEDVITVKHLNSVLLREDTVFARDVILTAMLHGNNKVPKRGHRLSKYKYGSPTKMLDTLIQEIGRDVAFFSLRKFCKHLYDQKMSFLEKGDCKELDIIKVIDVYEISHAYISFYMSNSTQMYPILQNIIRRCNNDSYFERTILAIDA